MDYELEKRLRDDARARRERGVLTWDDQLRASGLNPYYWATPASDGRLCPAVPESSIPPGALIGWQRSTEGLQLRTSPLAASSFDASDNTVDVTWTTGAAVLRQDYSGPFTEVLDVSPKAVRLGRLNAGAPFLNTHASGDLADVIGSVVPGSAKIAGGRGTCRILLSNARSSAAIIENIKAGVIRNISVGYLIHADRWTEGAKGAPPTRTVTDWEPLEISAVPIPADAGAQIRAA